jgi:DNA-binding HxlR family transcriptional regulator
LRTSLATSTIDTAALRRRWLQAAMRRSTHQLVSTEQAMPKKLARTFGCPSEFTLEVLGGKWKTVILCYLKQQPLRYKDLRQLIPNLSDKMLTERLSDLSARGLVAKKSVAGSTQQTFYVLTPLGKTLSGPLGELYKWGEQHAAAFDANVGNPLARLTHKSKRSSGGP